jgi:hypothetical protein
MVFGMESYNHIIATNSISLSSFIIPLFELCWLMATVIILQALIGSKLAEIIASKFVNIETGRPLAIILVRQISTVLVMCPIMSLVATFAFKNGFNSSFLSIWIKTIVINFPMALLWQILVAGPIVRFTVSKISQ